MNNLLEWILAAIIAVAIDRFARYAIRKCVKSTEEANQENIRS